MNEEIQTQPLQIMPQIPFTSPANMSSSIVTLTNPNSELNKMELTLRGQKFNLDGTISETEDPLMNEKGINSVMSQVQNIVNQVTIMSNLEEKEIPMILDFLADTLAKDLMINKEAYGITSLTTRDRIYFTVLSRAFICMKRAYMGDDKRFWKGTVQEIHTTVDSRQKQGMLGKLTGWGAK